MVFGLRVPIVDDVLDEGGEILEDAVDTVVDTANSVGRFFTNAADDLGRAAGDVGDAAADAGRFVVDAAENTVLEIVEIGGRIYRTIEDGFEGFTEDITDTADGIEWLAEQAMKKAEETAEDAADVVVDVAEQAAETAIDVGMWAWEAADYIQDKVTAIPNAALDFTASAAGDVLHPILDPILGENTTNDLIEAGVDFGQIYLTGGAEGVRDFVNQQVAAEAASLERQLISEAVGQDIGQPPETVMHYGLLRAQGMDPMQAAQKVGIDPTSELAEQVEEVTRPLIGEDGAAAVSQFARDLMTVYGQQASDLTNRSGLEQYGDRFDAANPGAAMTRHDPGWVTSRSEVDMLTDSGVRATGETLEAIWEPIVGQDAAEAIGEYGPRIGMEVFRTVATGGMSNGQAALTAARYGFEVATGQQFEDFVNDSVSREFAGVLGEDGAELLGQLTESGLRLGLGYAASHADGSAPDQHITDIDLDDFKDALIDFGLDQFRDLTGVDPNVANRLLLHAGNDNWTDQDSRDLVTVFRPIVPSEVRDIYDAAAAARNDDPDGALRALRGRLPEPLRSVFDEQQSSDSTMRNLFGSDPNASNSILDRMGVSTDDLNRMLSEDEAARGVEPHQPTGLGGATMQDLAAGAFDSMLGDVNIEPDDPAAPLVAQAVALQDTIGLLMTQGGPGAAAAIGQAQTMLVDLGRQVDLMHDTGPVTPSATRVWLPAATVAFVQVVPPSLDQR